MQAINSNKKLIMYSENNWFAPWYVIDSLKKSARTKNRQGHTEMWIAAMYAICRSTQDGSTWWVQFDKRNPPDARIMRKIDETDSLEIMDIECFELSEHDKNESLIEAIKRKLTKNNAPRQYGENTAIVGFLRRSLIIDASITEHIKNINPNCGSLVLVVDEKIGITTRSCVQLFPNYVKVTFDFKTSGRKDTQNPLMTTQRKGTFPIANKGEIVDVEMFP